MMIFRIVTSFSPHVRDEGPAGFKQLAHERDQRLDVELAPRRPGEHEPVEPQVVSAFLAITSAGTPLGAAGAGWLIAWLGFGPTHACIASSLTLATILLLLFVRRTRVVAEAIPAAAA